jgi:hypothetical protein
MESMKRRIAGGMCSLFPQQVARVCWFMVVLKASGGTCTWAHFDSADFGSKLGVGALLELRGTYRSSGWRVGACFGACAQRGLLVFLDLSTREISTSSCIFVLLKMLCI